MLDRLENRRVIRGRRRRRRSGRWEDYVIPVMLTAASLFLVADFASSTVKADSTSTFHERISSNELALPVFLRQWGDENVARQLAQLRSIENSQKLGMGGADGVSPGAWSRKRTSFSRQAFSEKPESGADALLAQIKSEKPVTITSGFGYRNLRGYVSHHDGIDIALPHGSPIHAAWDGEVTFAGWKSGYGQAVIIDHGNGRESIYAHASRLLVIPGQKVRGGELIARVGNTGRSYGAHLHFELRIGGTPVNPERHYLASRAVSSQSPASTAVDN